MNSNTETPPLPIAQTGYGRHQSWASWSVLQPREVARDAQRLSGLQDDSGDVCLSPKMYLKFFVTHISYQVPDIRFKYHCNAIY